MVQGQGGTEFRPAGILKYFEELKREPNTEIGPKDFFEIASSNRWNNGFTYKNFKSSGDSTPVKGDGSTVLK